MVQIAWHGGVVERARPHPDHLDAEGDVTLVAVRALGTVLTTVRGTVGLSGRATVERSLNDLINDEGNLTIVVDLRQATIAPAGEMVFILAACLARRLATRFILLGPGEREAEAMQSGVFGGLMEVVPRSALGTGWVQTDVVPC